MVVVVPGQHITRDALGGQSRSDGSGQAHGIKR